MRSLAYLFVLLLLAACAPKKQPVEQAPFKPLVPGRVQLPMELAQELPLLPLRVQGVDSLQWFVLNTYSEASGLSARLADSLGLAQAGGYVRGLQLRMDTVGLLLDSLPVVADEFSARLGRPIAGHLGRDVLRGKVLAMDAYQGQAALSDELPPLTGYVELPVSLDSLTGALLLQLALVDRLGDTARAPFRLASGTVGGLVVSGAFPEAMAQQLTDGPGYDYLQAALLDTHTLAQPPIEYAPSVGPLLNLAGAGVLARFAWVLDWRQPGAPSLYLKPNGYSEKPLRANLLGLELACLPPDYRNYYVVGVRPGSRAAYAGLLPGDRLQRINQQLAAHFSLSELTALLRVPNTMFLLQVQDSTGARREVPLPTTGLGPRE